MSKEIKEISTIKSKLWEAAVRSWIDLKNCIKVDERNENLENYADNIAAEPLFYNNLVKYRNKPLWKERWIRGGVRYIGQLFHNNRYLTVQEVAQRIGHYAGIYLDYFGVTNAIKQEWKQVMLYAHVLFDQEPDTKLQNLNLVKLSNKQLRKRRTAWSQNYKHRFLGKKT